LVLCIFKGKSRIM